MTRYVVGVALGLLVAPSVAQAQRSNDLIMGNGQVNRGFKNVKFTKTPAELAPRPENPPPDCNMIVVPTDPSLDPLMPIPKVDERFDPKFVQKVVPCRVTDVARPPR